MTQHESSRSVTPPSTRSEAVVVAPGELAQAVYVALIQRGHGGTLPDPKADAAAFAAHAEMLVNHAKALALAFAQPATEPHK